MKYHARTKQFTVAPEALDRAAFLLRHAIAKIRICEDLPMGRYQRTGPYLAADSAMDSIVDAARTMGIDLGGSFGHEIDVSDLEVGNGL